MAGPGCHGRGHRPCHSATLASGPAGGQSPRPAPDPPMAGASRPPGRALACVVPGPAGLQGTVPRGRGKRGAFPVPARRGESTVTASMAGAIAPAMALRWDQDQPGAKAPGQRPTRPWRALRTRRVGRWPLSLPDLPVYRTPFRAGGGNALRFLFPPGGANGRTRMPWQGPSPLPQETRCVSCSRPEGRMAGPGCHGRGHRPCHSATLASGPAGGQSPRPAPDPPLAGASRPPGRALAFRDAWTCRSTGDRAARAGETPCVSCSRPERRSPGCPVSLAGAIAPAKAPRCPLPAGGQSPRPAPDPPPAGAGLLLFPDLPVCGAPFRAGGGNAGRVS